MRILNQVVDVLPEHDEMPNGVGFERNLGMMLGSIPRRETDWDGIILESIEFRHQEVFYKCGDGVKVLAGGVEASGAGGEPEGMSGDTSHLGVVDMVVGSNYRLSPRSRESSKNFNKVRVRMLGR